MTKQLYINNLEMFENRLFGRSGGVKIEDGSWVGCNVVILSGVHIGKNAIVGANSLVKEDVPDNTVVVGSPVRAISKYDKEKNSLLELYDDKKSIEHI